MIEPVIKDYEDISFRTSRHNPDTVRFASLIIRAYEYFKILGMTDAEGNAALDFARVVISNQSKKT